MGRIFTTKGGNVEVTFFNTGFHACDREPRQTVAWREVPHGERELVHWQHGQWVSDIEINTARVAARTF